MRALEEETGCKVIEIYFDRTDAEGMKEAIKEIRSYKRDIDILVNNAGVLSAYRNFSMMPIQEVRQTFEVDFFCPDGIYTIYCKTYAAETKGKYCIYFLNRILRWIFLIL